MKLFLKLAFLGTNYHGYQVQENGDTVQARLNAAAEQLFGFPCDVVGCSRTDSGVHAAAFCVTVAKRGEPSLPFTIPTDKVPVALNSLLPEDISILEAREVEDSFHARYDVVSKEYEYKIWNGPCKNPFLADRAHYLPKSISDETLEKMNFAASAFVGTHDFSSFMAQGSKITDPRHTVHCADLRREGDMIIFRVAADGFLYNMVRIMVGTLIDVAQGRIAPDAVSAILSAKNRQLAGATAPACGLYLNKVFYKE